MNQPQSESVACKAVALARWFVPCQRKVPKMGTWESVLIGRLVERNWTAAG